MAHVSLDSWEEGVGAPLPGQGGQVGREEAGAPVSARAGGKSGPCCVGQLNHSD